VDLLRKNPVLGGKYAEGEHAGAEKQIEHTNYSPFVSEVRNFSQVFYGLIGKASVFSCPPSSYPGLAERVGSGIKVRNYLFYATPVTRASSP